MFNGAEYILLTHYIYVRLSAATTCTSKIFRFKPGTRFYTEIYDDGNHMACAQNVIEFQAISTSKNYISMNFSNHNNLFTVDRLLSLYSPVQIIGAQTIPKKRAQISNIIILVKYPRRLSPNHLLALRLNTKHSN